MNTTYDINKEKTTFKLGGGISLSRDKYAKAVNDNIVIYIDDEPHICSVIEFEKWSKLSEKEVNRISLLSKSISYNSFIILPNSFPDCSLEEWSNINAYLVVYKG
jgi:hypothetical protein